MNHWRIARRALAALTLLALALSPAVASASRSMYDTVYNLTACAYDRRSGDSGSEVRYIQQRLIDLGYLNDKADGKFGSKTKRAVELFQRNNGIHGNNNNYGVATEMTQAVLFSSEALPYYSAPRLSSWSMGWSEDRAPYSIIGRSYLNYPSDSFCLHFTIENENPSQDLTGIVVRYWLQDRNNTLVKYNGYECYQVTVDFHNNIEPFETGEVSIYLAPGVTTKAHALRWVVTELSYANGEVIMDYDATRRSYTLWAYITEFGWQ